MENELKEKYKDLTLEQLEAVIKEYFDQHPNAYKVQDLENGYVELSGPGIHIVVSKAEYEAALKKEMEKVVY